MHNRDEEIVIRGGQGTFPSVRTLADRTPDASPTLRGQTRCDPLLSA
jgi:hypothetical protein